MGLAFTPSARRSIGSGTLFKKVVHVACELGIRSGVGHAPHDRMRYAGRARIRIKIKIEIRTEVLPGYALGRDFLVPKIKTPKVMNLLDGNPV